MKVNAVRCPTCGDLIYSRARHDYHSCGCGAVSIDGGFDYIQVSGIPDIENGNFKVYSLYVKATKKQLYDDWNKRKDRYGLKKTTKGENKEGKK